MSLAAHAIASRVRSGALSAQTVVAAALERIRTSDAALNCFTTVLHDRALLDARAVDACLRSGNDPGPLAGVPIGVKELYDVEGVVTRAGSKCLASDSPARSDAVLLRRLRAAGAVLLGCQNMDEFAYGFSTENSHYGTTRNPHDTTRIAGGSSGGSAASVGAGLVPISLGSDTNGSIRVPASFCGVFGMKPTFGRLPRTGTFPFVHDLDHVGHFAGNVMDLALTYDLLQGNDAGDAACARRPIELTRDGLDRDLSGLKLGVLNDWFERGASAAALESVQRVAEAFGPLSRVHLPEAERARAAAFCITAASGAALHLERLKTRPQDFDPATRDRLLAGALLPGALIARAQRLRRWFAEQARSLFSQVDILIAPATPDVAPFIGQKTMQLAGAEVPVRATLGLYTQPISFIGLPVVVVPIWTGSHLPIGVQIIAPPWREDLALSVAYRLEQLGVVNSKHIAAERSGPIH